MEMISTFLLEKLIEATVDANASLYSHDQKEFP
jgi:hypothetical protein